MSRRLVVFAIASGSLALALLVGCSTETREKILPYFFDGFSPEAQKQRPPTRRLRRDLLQESEQLKRELAETKAQAKARAQKPGEETRPPIEQAKGWEEASQNLPKDNGGHVDWIQALRAGAIAPRPAIDPKGPFQAVLDLDVDLTGPGKASRLFRVVFSHAAHTEWVTCGSCHPAIFPLKRQVPTVVTMAEIKQGGYCGVCHGPVAFGLGGGCARCHKAIPAKSHRPAEEVRKPIERAATWEEALKLLPVVAGGPDWPKALAEGVIAPRPGIDPKAEDEPVFPLEVELIPAKAPALKVVFPHDTHTALLSCASCHPGIFKMEAGADPITMEKIFAGEYCGRCHGKVAFQPATACGRCHPVMTGG